MTPYRVRKELWWRVEVSLDFATILTMVKAASEDEARQNAYRDCEQTGQRPLACSKPFCLGPAT